MASILEFEEKNVELAVEKACEALKVKKEELAYDVLSYGSTGIFGLVGSKRAKIRVKLPQVDGLDTNLDTKWKNELEDTRPETVNEDGFHARESTEEVSESESSPLAETEEICRQALQRIIDTITSDATISVKRDTDLIVFDVKGGNPAVLIGKRGQTLEAIQYLIEKIANKRNDQRVRVQVDVEGYQKSRRMNLEKLAARLAEKAVRTGKPMTIGEINAHDRRIVHLALKNDNGVRTQSLGNGTYRKLMILPKKRSPDKRASARGSDV
jgi:spoIIIJ-associated protein